LADIKYTRDSQLPWSASFDEDRLFKIVLIAFVIFMVASAFWIASVKLKPVDRRELDKLPPTIAKVIIKKKEELKRVELPKEPPNPKPVEKPEPKSDEPKPKVEPKPVQKPKPSATKPSATKPTQQDIKEAQDRAKGAGVLKMKDQLASMRSAFAPKMGAGSGIKTGTAAGAKGVGVSRTQIVGKGTGGSGGIAMAGGASSGTGGGGGSSRGDYQVDSVSLGGQVVDDGGDVREAIESSKAGKRSEESIRAILDQNKAGLYAIYNRALRGDPSLQGKVTFKIVIDPDGSVSSCTIVSSDLADAGLKSKLVSRMKMIDFGAANASATTTQWAIDFLPY